MSNKKELSAGICKRDGISYIPFMEADPDMIIVSMCSFQDKLYCATQKGVYILKEDKFHRIEMKEFEPLK